MSPCCLLHFHLHFQQYPFQVVCHVVMPREGLLALRAHCRVQGPKLPQPPTAPASCLQFSQGRGVLVQSVGQRDVPWHSGTRLQWRGQGRAERGGVVLPAGLRVSVRARWEKKLKEIISRISATTFHSSCYLSLVGRHSLSKTCFQTKSGNELPLS